MGQVMPSDYPNNLNQGEKRKKRYKSVSDVPLRDIHNKVVILFNTPKRGTWKQFLTSAELEWIQVEIHRNTVPLSPNTYSPGKNADLTTPKKTA